MAAELNARTKKLMSLYKFLADENLKLQSVNDKLVKQNNELKQNLKKQEEINKALRLGQALGTDTVADQNTRDLKMKLNHFINEIDKCLTMMHQ